MPFVLASCAANSSYFPSDVGLKWTYSVRTGFGAEHVEDVEVERRLSVAGTEGFEIGGPMGSSRLAWKRGVLWAERMANVAFSPPLPIFAEDRRAMRWEGTLRTAFGLEKASALLEHDSDTLKPGGRVFETVAAKLTMQRPLGETILTTWFAEGVGIVRQDQRTRDELDLRLEWVAGPSRG